MDRESLFRAGRYCLAAMALALPVRQANAESIVSQELRSPLSWYRESWSSETTGLDKTLEVESAAARSLGIGRANLGDWSEPFNSDFFLPAWPSGVTVRGLPGDAATAGSIVPASSMLGHTMLRTATFSPSWVGWDETQAYGDPLPESSSLVLASFALFGLAGYQWRRLLQENSWWGS